MSKVGKIFCILAIVLSLVSAGLGVMVALKKSAYKQQLAETENALKLSPMVPPYSADFESAPEQPAAYISSLNKGFQSTKEELKTTQDTLTEKEGKLSEAEAKVQQLTTSVTEVKKERDTAVEAQKSAETQASEAQSKLKTLEDALGGQNPQELVGKVKQLGDDVKVLAAEKKILEDGLAQKTAELDKMLMLEKLRLDKKAPMDLSGKVVAINKAWNFVVLDVGKDNLLNEGVDLTVYRGETMIGKIRCVSVDANSAIADILPDWTKSEIQVGDKVLY